MSKTSNREGRLPDGRWLLKKNIIMREISITWKNASSKALDPAVVDEYPDGSRFYWAPSTRCSIEYTYTKVGTERFECFRQLPDDIKPVCMRMYKAMYRTAGATLLLRASFLMTVDIADLSRWAVVLACRELRRAQVATIVYHYASHWYPAYTIYRKDKELKTGYCNVHVDNFRNSLLRSGVSP